MRDDDDDLDHDLTLRDESCFFTLFGRLMYDV